MKTPVAATQDLLKELFTATDLRIHLSREPGGSALEEALPEQGVTLAVLSAAAVTALGERLLDPKFFDRLVEARPLRVAAIRDVQSMWIDGPDQQVSRADSRTAAAPRLGSDAAGVGEIPETPRLTRRSVAWVAIIMTSLGLVVAGGVLVAVMDGLPGLSELAREEAMLSFDDVPATRVEEPLAIVIPERTPTSGPSPALGPEGDLNPVVPETGVRTKSPGVKTPAGQLKKGPRRRPDGSVVQYVGGKRGYPMGNGSRLISDDPYQFETGKHYRIVAVGCARSRHGATKGTVSMWLCKNESGCDPKPWREWNYSFTENGTTTIILENGRAVEETMDRYVHLMANVDIWLEPGFAICIGTNRTCQQVAMEVSDCKPRT